MQTSCGARLQRACPRNHATARDRGVSARSRRFCAEPIACYPRHVPARRPQPDDLYGILGLVRGATDDDVRRAYRQLAMRWHPDRAGGDTTFIFQRLTAAYEVLADPVRRAAYDRELPPEPTPARAPSEPEREPPRKAPAVLIRRLSSPIDVLLASRIAERADDGTIVLHVRPEEAAEGGMVTIAMRVAIRCPACGGGDGACARCGGTRVVDELYSAWLAIRPGVADGAAIAPSVQMRGVLRPVGFRIRIAR
jgi:hypothetical protein